MKIKTMFKSFMIIMCLVIGTACSSNEAKDNKSDGDASEKVEIEFWYGLGSEADVKMKEIIESFNASQEQYTVKPVPQANYDETYQKLQAAIASDTAPGVFITGGESMRDLAAKDAIVSLNSFIDNDDSFAEEDFLDVFLEPAKLEDSYYGLPAYGTTQVMYYRKDLYEEAGIDPKEAFASWENLAKASKELQDKELVEYGHLPMWGSGNLMDIAVSNGGKILNDDQTEVLIDQPEWVDAWEFIRENVHEEKTMKVNSGGQGWEYWYKTIDEVMNGKAASYTGSSGDKGNLDFDIIGSAVQPGLNGNDAKPHAGSLYMSIPEGISDTEKEAAYAWMAYFTTPVVNADWAQTIGYIPVKHTAMEVENYAAFIEENDYAGVPFEQAQTGNPDFIDPTGGKILDALTIATDKVELENISALEALTEAKETAQKALDEVNK